MKYILFTLFSIFIFFQELSGCTGILLHAQDKSVVNGRTVEFGSPIDMYPAVIPRNFTFTGKSTSGGGLIYKSKYAAAGAYCFDYQVLMDGMNEKGLSAAAFYFPGYASYTKITKKNQSKSLSPVEFPNWILTQFATIDEVKEALNSIVIAPTVISNWGSSPPPFHYIVYDKTGKSIVIEPINGTLVVHENALGVITNSPTFDWHLTNLRNFINLTPVNAKPIDIRGLEFKPFGQGSGMVGLPGDFTPPSRFVRAAIFSTTEIAAKDSNELVNQAFHILNQFDIPFGVTRESEGDQTAIDYTLMTTVKDPQNMKYYFRSYEDQTIHFIDLKQFNLDAKTIKSMKKKGKQTYVDVSASLH